MFRIAIVEDESDSLERLAEAVQRWSGERGVKCEIVKYEDGMNFVSDYRPIYDVVLMDIEMPYMNGLDAAKQLRKIDPNVALVFVTHLAKYALHGYEVDAVGYIVKPVEYPALARRLDKIAARREFAGGESAEYYVKTSAGTVRFMLGRLMYVEVMDHFLIYHTEDGTYRAYGQISREEQKLPSEYFFRCGKSYIVNLAYVTKISRGSVIVGGDEVPVGRTRQKELKSAFNRYIGGMLHG